MNRREFLLSASASLLPSVSSAVQPGTDVVEDSYDAIDFATYRDSWLQSFVRTIILRDYDRVETEERDINYPYMMASLDVKRFPIPIRDHVSKEWIVRCVDIEMIRREIRTKAIRYIHYPEGNPWENEYGMPDEYCKYEYLIPLRSPGRPFTGHSK